MLDTIPFTSSPNKHKGGLTPEGIVIHFTVSGGSDGSKKWLTNPASKASAHYLIAQDGTIDQLVSLEDRAWHAGPSSWAGKQGCNNFMIGIELVNWGPLKLLEDGFSMNSYNKIIKVPIFTDVRSLTHWEVYPTKQIDQLYLLCAELQQKYEFSGASIVGHDMVSPGRKVDPGPAFPWEKFDALTFNQYGTLKDNIKNLQSHILSFDIDVGNIDGVWGPKTEKGFLEVCREHKVATLLQKDWINDKNYIGSLANKLRAVRVSHR